MPLVAVGVVQLRIDGKLYECDSITVELYATDKTLATIKGLRAKKRAVTKPKTPRVTGSRSKERI